MPGSETGAASELAELVKIAQDADAQWMRANRGKFGTWQRVADDQAKRLIVAALEHYAAGHASDQAGEHGGAASELRDQLVEALIAHARRGTDGKISTFTERIIRVTAEQRADAVLAAPALRARLERLAEYENAITWETSCLSCSRTLDASYAETVRREQAEAAIQRVQVALALMRYGINNRRPSDERDLGRESACEVIDDALSQPPTDAVVEIDVTDSQARYAAAVERAREYLDALIANGFGATGPTLRALRAVLGGPPAKEDLGRPLSSRHEALLGELLEISENAGQPPAEKEEDPK